METRIFRALFARFDVHWRVTPVTKTVALPPAAGRRQDRLLDFVESRADPQVVAVNCGTGKTLWIPRRYGSFLSHGDTPKSSKSLDYVGIETYGVWRNYSILDHFRKPPYEIYENLIN